MTAPLFNLPIASPIAGAPAANGGQGAPGGFEALLAAFFGAQGDPAAGGLLAGQPATDGDKPAEEAASELAALTTPPAEALNLAALIAAQPQAVQAPDATQTAGGTGADKPQPPSFAAALPAAPQALAQAGLTASQNQTQVAAGTEAAAEPAMTGLAQQVEPPVARKAEPSAPDAAKPSAAAARPAPIQAPAVAPVELAQAEAAAAPAAEALASAEVAVEPQPSAAAPKPARHADQARRSGPAAPTAAAAQPLADDAVLPTAVTAVAHAESAAEPASALETEAPPPAAREAAAQPAPDAPDFQPQAPAAAGAAHAHAAAPPAGPARATAETIANLTAQIGKKLDGRATKFDVELTPAWLGHVSVAVEIAASGKMTAAMSFESPQAAAELRARSHELQRALEQAGFDLSGGLSFDVAGDAGHGAAQQQQQQQQNDGAAWRGRAFQAVLGTAGEAAETAAAAALSYTRRSDAGVDIWI